jgi:hypothetical protein
LYEERPCRPRSHRQTDPIETNKLFTLALGLASPWRVAELKFDPKEERMDINVDCPGGSTFSWPTCGEA